jgi:hypothetical protein
VSGMRALLLYTSALTLVLAATAACKEQEGGADVGTSVAGRTATPVATEPGPYTTAGGVPTGGLPVPTEGVSPTPELTPTAAPTDGFVTIDIGQFSGYSSEAPEVVVARDDREWAALWAGHRSETGEAPPDVDFANRQVLGVFLGASGGGDTVEVTSVSASQGALVVRATRQTPAQGCGVPAVVTYPFHIVSVPRMPGDPELVLQTQVVACN